MGWTIIAVGTLKQGPEYDLCQTYIKRCQPPIKIIEISAKNMQSDDQQKHIEADLIQKSLPQNSFVVALDERGKTMTSTELATYIKQIHTRGIAHITFVIGGAFGLHPDIRNRADLVLSFGKLTLPHMLVRAVLCEQLYRLQTIISRHPYHKI